jgi:hypothetical protein
MTHSSATAPGADISPRTVALIAGLDEPAVGGEQTAGPPQPDAVAS